MRQQHDKCGTEQVGMAAQHAGGAAQQQGGNAGQQQRGDNVIPPAQQQGSGILPVLQFNTEQQLIL